MIRRVLPGARPRRNRRAVLRGLFGVSVGLPFLESLPQRSAWAAEEKPIFSLFLCATEGVVPQQFFPADVGAFTESSLAAAGKATSELARHAKRLQFVKNVNWVVSTGTGEPHAESIVLALTARPATTPGNQASSTGPSADWVIADKVQPGTPPLALYAGNLRNGYIANRLSFEDAGVLAPVNDNPYKLYQELIGIAGPGGTPTPQGEAAARLLAESRNSVHDLVRDELKALMGNSRLSAADKQRLQHHWDAIRDMEITMDHMGDDHMERCSATGLDIDKLEALENYKYTSKGDNEEIVRLHMSLVALAFACNYNRTASLQWGDGLDKIIYDVPSNVELGMWPFSFISHRIQSDGAVGDDAVAAQAHAEIDTLRMKALAAGLDHFEARGLGDQAFVLWVNALADGPTHSYKNVPHILWGNGGGFLKQATYTDAGGVKNNQMLNTLISVAIQDTGIKVEDFGEGTPGMLTSVLV